MSLDAQFTRKHSLSSSLQEFVKLSNLYPEKGQKGKLDSITARRCLKAVLELKQGSSAMLPAVLFSALLGEHLHQYFIMGVNGATF